MQTPLTRILTLQKAGVSELSALMKAVMDGTSNSDEIDKLVFDTINWINENTSWDGGSITDNEASLSETTYALMQYHLTIMN